MVKVQVTAGASDGEGRVTSSNGIDCRVSQRQVGGTCAVDAVDGSQISLSATVVTSSGSIFEGWRGDCQITSSGACIISVNGASRIATAQFFGEKSLSVALLGDGGAQVTLSATPQAGSVFKGWSGGCDDALSLRCTTSVDRATTVGARFERTRGRLRCRYPDREPERF